MVTPNVVVELKFMLFGIFNDFYYILLESTIVSKITFSCCNGHKEFKIRGKNAV